MELAWVASWDFPVALALKAWCTLCSIHHICYCITHGQGRLPETAQPRFKTTLCCKLQGVYSVCKGFHSVKTGWFDHREQRCFIFPSAGLPHIHLQSVYLWIRFCETNKHTILLDNFAVASNTGKVSMFIKELFKNNFWFIVSNCFICVSVLYPCDPGLHKIFLSKKSHKWKPCWPMSVSASWPCSPELRLGCCQAFERNKCPWPGQRPKHSSYGINVASVTLLGWKRS